MTIPKAAVPTYDLQENHRAGDSATGQDQDCLQGAVPEEMPRPRGRTPLPLGAPAPASLPLALLSQALRGCRGPSRHSPRGSWASPHCCASLRGTLTPRDAPHPQQEEFPLPTPAPSSRSREKRRSPLRPTALSFPIRTTARCHEACIKQIHCLSPDRDPPGTPCSGETLLPSPLPSSKGLLCAEREGTC